MWAGSRRASYRAHMPWLERVWPPCCIGSGWAVVSKPNFMKFSMLCRVGSSYASSCFFQKNVAHARLTATTSCSCWAVLFVCLCRIGVFRVGHRPSWPTAFLLAVRPRKKMKMVITARGQ